MSDQEQSQDQAEAARMGQVDQAAGVHEPTEADEEAVLRELYGEPDEAGIYRGEERA